MLGEDDEMLMNNDDRDKKHILFVINNMRIGGTRKSLLNLFTCFPHDKVNVDLLLLSQVGEYINSIDSHVNLLRTPYLCRCAFSKINELCFPDSIIKVMISLLWRVFGYKTVFSFIYKRAAKVLSRETEYDAVFGFQEGESNDCASFIPSPRHYLWIHNNYEYFIGNGKGLKSSYDLAENIIFVAEASLQTFKKLNIVYSSKLTVIKNILPQEQIIYEAKQKIIDEDLFSTDTLNFVSVGRISHQKGFNRAIEVASRLKQEGYIFRWLIIGEGENKDTLQKSIDDKDLNKYVLLIGARNNPYPYIKKADLFILTSYYESQPMVLMEALTIGTPVISTRFDSVNEIIEDKPYALLVENTVEGIYTGITSLYNNNSLDQMKMNVNNFLYNNEKIIKQILQLINQS